MKLFCLTGYILQKILLDISFHYTTVVLRVWDWQSQKCKSKCPNETLNGLFQKNFQVFYFTLENSLSLNLPPSPFVFFHYSICTVISDCNHPSILLIKAPVSQEYIIAIENTYLNGFFFWIKNFYFSVKEISILNS